MATISVIVPVYKVEPYLKRCVDSLLAQTFGDFDLILVDDGSPDRCGEMCQEFSRRDRRVHALHRENGGLSAARNTGIDWALSHSEAQWLAFVDSDDWVAPDYLRVLYDAVAKTGCSLAACGVYPTAGEPLPEGEEADVVTLSADDYYCSDLHGGLIAVAWNKLYKRQLFRDLRYPEGKLHEDQFTTYRAVYQAGAVAVTQARLYAYYCNPQGIMASTWSPRRMDALEAFRQQLAFARETGNGRLLAAVAEAYIYAAYDQLSRADRAYRGQLRRELRRGLRLGRESGCFPRSHATLWAYEAAYPMKPVWWLVSRLTGGNDHG